MQTGLGIKIAIFPSRNAQKEVVHRKTIEIKYKLTHRRGNVSGKLWTHKGNGMIHRHENVIPINLHVNCMRTTGKLFSK